MTSVASLQEAATHLEDALSNCPFRDPLHESLTTLHHALTVAASNLTRLDSPQQWQPTITHIASHTRSVARALSPNSMSPPLQPRLADLSARTVRLQATLHARGFYTAFHPPLAHIAFAHFIATRIAPPPAPSRALCHALCDAMYAPPVLLRMLRAISKHPCTASAILQAVGVADSPRHSVFTPQSADKVAQSVVPSFETLFHLFEQALPSLSTCTNVTAEIRMANFAMRHFLARLFRHTDLPALLHLPPHPCLPKITVNPATCLPTFCASYSIVSDAALLYSAAVSVTLLPCPDASRSCHKTRTIFEEETFRLHTLVHPCLLTFLGAHMPPLRAPPFLSPAPPAAAALFDSAFAVTERMTCALREARNHIVFKTDAPRLRVLNDVALALCHLHGLRQCHGALTADHVLVHIEDGVLHGRAKLDLSHFLVRRLKGVVDQPYVTAFTPPEVFLGKDDGWYTTDVWSFGVLIVFLFQDGRHDHLFENSFAMLRVVAVNAVHALVTKFVSAVRHPECKMLAFDCLQLDPTKRPPVTAVLDRIIAIVESAPAAKAASSSASEKEVCNASSIMQSPLNSPCPKEGLSAQKNVLDQPRTPFMKRRALPVLRPISSGPIENQGVNSDAADVAKEAHPVSRQGDSSKVLGKLLSSRTSPEPPNDETHQTPPQTQKTTLDDPYGCLPTGISEEQEKSIPSGNNEKSVPVPDEPALVQPEPDLSNEPDIGPAPYTHAPASTSEPVAQVSTSRVNGELAKDAHGLPASPLTTPKASTPVPGTQPEATPLPNAELERAMPVPSPQCLSPPWNRLPRPKTRPIPESPESPEPPDKADGPEEPIRQPTGRPLNNDETPEHGGSAARNKPSPFQPACRSMVPKGSAQTRTDQPLATDTSSNPTQNESTEPLFATRSNPFTPGSVQTPVSSPPVVIISDDDDDDGDGDVVRSVPVQSSRRQNKSRRNGNIRSQPMAPLHDDDEDSSGLDEPGQEKTAEKTAEEKKQAEKANFYGKRYFYGTNNVVADVERAFSFFQDAANGGSADGHFNLAGCYHEGRGTTSDQGRADDHYHTAAMGGHLEAQMKLAERFEEIDSNEDKKTALSWYKKAALQNDPLASFKVGYFCEHGIATNRDMDEAIRLYEMSANGECGEAELRLAELYEAGHRVAVDIPRAIEYYKRSAVHGHENAQLALAKFYDQGKLVSKDNAEAAKYYMMASSNGGAVALYEAAFCLEKGKGLKANLSRARAMYEDAADQGMAKAMFRIGLMDANGVNCDVDRKSAIKWWKSAAEHGLTEANLKLGKCAQEGYGMKKSPGEALRFFKKACDKGNAEACVLAGLIYERGEIGKERRIEQAAKFYETGARLGNARAEGLFGQCLLTGCGKRRDVDRAIRYFESAARQGDALSLFELGDCYREGIGVKPDVKKSTLYYEKSAMNGFAEAQVRFADCLLSATGVEKDVGKALQFAEQAIAQKFGGGYRFKGDYFADGLGCPVDKKKAAEWYRKGAERKDDFCIVRLAGLYESGEGVPLNMKIAFSWYSKAANMGCGLSMNNVGVMYEKGDGVKQSFHKAFEHYKKAERLGSVEATSNLGDCYMKGHGISKDVGKAVVLYEEAANNGDRGAKCELGICFYEGNGVVRDYKRAVALFRSAGKDEESEALRRLAVAYVDGCGVEQRDCKEAVGFFQRAVDLGNCEAIVDLAKCFRYGQGVKQNPEKAAGLFKTAVEKGNITAMKHLGNMYHEGIGVALDRTKSVELYKQAHGVLLTAYERGD